MAAGRKLFLADCRLSMQKPSVSNGGWLRLRHPGQYENILQTIYSICICICNIVKLLSKFNVNAIELLKIEFFLYIESKVK